MAYSEFYCQTSASNLNAGSTTSDAAAFTFTNGGWDATTGVFTATGANLSAISAGMFASVYLDGASVAVFVGRITAVNDTTDTITVSLTAKSGTAPTTGLTGRTIKVGGAWKGPNAAENFPFNFVQSTMTNAAGDFPRVNLKNNATYSITAAVTHANAGPTVLQGYTSTVGDGGKAIIDGGTTGASYTPLTVSGANVHVADLIVANNGATGSAAGLAISGTDCVIHRVVVHDVRGAGFSSTASNVFVECEAYASNQSNTASLGGFVTTGNASLRRCISHDNAGSNSQGFRCTGSTILVVEDCIADSNGSDGLFTTNTVFAQIAGYEAYNNGGDGLDLNGSGVAGLYVENSNFVKNGGFGINVSGAGSYNGAIVNCGFGSGTQANTAGATSALGPIDISGSITYASNVTPWVDPANGDFRISLAAAKGTGRGTFTQTQAGYSGTVGYPDVGAAQHLETASGTTAPMGLHAIEMGAV